MNRNRQGKALRWIVGQGTSLVPAIISPRDRDGLHQVRFADGHIVWMPSEYVLIDEED